MIGERRYRVGRAYRRDGFERIETACGEKDADKPLAGGVSGSAEAPLDVEQSISAAGFLDAERHPEGSDRKLCPEQPPRQQLLQVAPTIRYYIDDAILTECSIDYAIGLEKRLTILPDAKITEFSRHGTSIRHHGKISCDLEQALQHVIGVLHRIIGCDEVVDVFEITLRIRGEQNRATHD